MANSEPFPLAITLQKGAFMKNALIALTVFLLSSCQTLPPAERAFKKQTQRFFDELWPTYPGFALSVGLHDYDDDLPIPDKNTFLKQENFARRHLEAFKAVDVSGLSPASRADLDLMVNFLEQELWTLKEFRSHEWNPSVYNIGYDLSSVLQGAHKSEIEKWRDLSKRIEKVPAYYRAARENLRRPTQEHTELAIKQNKGLVDFIGKDLTEKVKASGIGAEEKMLWDSRAQNAVAAIREYVNFLEGVMKKPQTVGGFRGMRLSPELYARKFELQIQASSSAKDIYERALRDKERTLKKMAPLAAQLWPKYFPGRSKPDSSLKMIRQVIDKVARHHTKPEDFVETIRRQIPQLTDFVNKSGLLTLDPGKPLNVRETPVYMRGVAGASVDSPGPFEAQRETYYNVTPLDGMSPQARESYLREYNDYTLQILNIHEAIPGHYVQLVYANRSPSLAKSVFANGTMIEGWAVYSELAMMEAGYGDGSPELWLMYYKWFLRVVTNMIIDYEIHNKELSRGKAMHYMVNEAFQEKAEAEQKWIRATVTQVQLASYYTGFKEILDLREELKKREGANFKLKDFHERFLSYGSASVKAIRELMLAP